MDWGVPDLSSQNAGSGTVCANALWHSTSSPTAGCCIWWLNSGDCHLPASSLEFLVHTAPSHHAISALPNSAAGPSRKPPFLAARGSSEAQRGTCTPRPFAGQRTARGRAAPPPGRSSLTLPVAAEGSAPAPLPLPERPFPPGRRPAPRRPASRR